MSKMRPRSLLLAVQRPDYTLLSPPDDTSVEGSHATAAGTAVGVRCEKGTWTSSSHRPGHRPGPDRVPADLEHGAPADRPRLHGMGGPGRGVHRRHPAQGRWPPSCSISAAPICGRIVAAFLRGVRDPSERRGLDFRMGVLIIIGTIPIAIFGFLFRHQIEDSALADADRHHADRARPRAAAGREGRPPRSRARHDLDPRRHRDRLRPGPRARPGRVALGRDADGEAVPGLRPRVGGALFVPALGARRGAQRRVRAAQHRRRGRRGLRGHGARDRHGLHLRLRDDRLPPALAREPLDGDLRRLPDRTQRSVLVLAGAGTIS